MEFSFDSGISLSSPELSPYVFKLLERFLVKWRNLTARLERKLYTNFSATKLFNLKTHSYLGFDEQILLKMSIDLEALAVGGFGSVHQNHFLEKPYGK
jgi:hypothetical protein